MEVSKLWLERARKPGNVMVGHLMSCLPVNQQWPGLPLCPVASPGQLGCVCVCSWGSSSPLAKAHVSFLDWPGPISSQVGGAPRSGVYINLEARNKDEGDPGEKGSLHPSIYNTSAPPPGGSTLAQRHHCVSRGSTSAPFTEFVLGKWVQSTRLNAWRLVCLCRKIRGCCRLGLGS